MTTQTPEPEQQPEHVDKEHQDDEAIQPLEPLEDGDSEATPEGT